MTTRARHRFLIVLPLTAMLVAACGTPTKTPPPPRSVAPTPTPPTVVEIPDALRIPSLHVMAPPNWIVTGDQRGRLQKIQMTPVDKLGAPIGASLTILRDSSDTKIETTLNDHFKDTKTIVSVNFPPTPPNGKCLRVAGLTGYSTEFDYSEADVAAHVQVVVTVHQGVGYVITMASVGADGKDALAADALLIVASMSFIGDEVLPSPTTTPNVTPTPAPTGIACA